MTALLLVILMIAGMAACGTKDEPKAQERKSTNGKADNTLTIALHEPTVSLDPQHFTSTSDNELVRQIYDGLFHIENDDTLTLDLAESMEEDPETGDVAVKLLEGVKFHSGDVLTSEDVEYTFSRIELSTLTSVIYGLVTVETVDDLNFIMHFPLYEAGYGFGALASYIESLLIVNKSFVETITDDVNEDIKLNVDGTGAYMFNGIESNGDVILVKNPEFWGEAGMDKLCFRYISGDSTTAFEAGDIDYAQYMAGNVKVLDNYTNVEKDAIILNSIGFVVMNCTEGAPTADLKVRQAAAYCMNQEDLAIIAGGEPSYIFSGPLVRYADQSLVDHFDVDIEKANALMKEAGYSDSNKLAVSLLCYSGYPDWVAACEAMKEQLEKSYFTVTIDQTADLSPYYNYSHDMAFISVNVGTEYAGYGAMFDMGTGLNLAGYVDDELLAKIYACNTEETVHEAMKEATETLAYIPVFSPALYFGFDDGLDHPEFLNSMSGFLYRYFSWK